MQLPSPRHREGIGRVGVLDPQRDIALQLAIQPLSQVPPRYELPLATRERGVVDQHVHRDRRLLDRDAGEPVEVIGRGDRLADLHARDAGDRHDLTGARLLDLGALQSLGRE